MRRRRLIVMSCSSSAFDLDLDRLERLVRAGPARLGGTRLVAVDGPAGSGKTTTASALVDRLRARSIGVGVLHMDDLYEGWTGLDEGVERRLQTQVVEPLSAGQPGCWRRYDWVLGEFAEWHELPPPEVLVLEGCGSGAAGRSPYLTMLVWVEAAASVRLARGIERDGPDVEPKWRAWMQLEDAHFAANRTRERADVRITTG